MLPLTSAAHSATARAAPVRDDRDQDAEHPHGGPGYRRPVQQPVVDQGTGIT